MALFMCFLILAASFGKKYEETTIQSSSDLCMYLIHTAHVSTVTGSAFGAANSIRISFANSMENIEKGFARIREALGKLV